jgi:hypothetical protein
VVPVFSLALDTALVNQTRRNIYAPAAAAMVLRLRRLQQQRNPISDVTGIAAANRSKARK